MTVTKRTLFVVLTWTALAGARCPDVSWDEYEGHCYKFFHDVEVTMDSAERYCMGYGGHLASVLSVGENSHLGDKVGYSDSYWIGWRQKDTSTADDTNDFTWTDGSPSNGFSCFNYKGTMLRMKT